MSKWKGKSCVHVYEFNGSTTQLEQFFVTYSKGIGITYLETDSYHYKRNKHRRTGLYVYFEYDHAAYSMYYPEFRYKLIINDKGQLKIEKIKVR